MLLCMDEFKHEILGELDTTTYWFKFLPQPIFIELIVIGVVLMVSFNVFPKNAFFICLYVFVILTELVLILLRLLKRDSNNYMAGGGYTYYDYFARKLYRKTHKKIYTLGISAKEEE